MASQSYRRIAVELGSWRISKILIIDNTAVFLARISLVAPWRKQIYSRFTSAKQLEYEWCDVAPTLVAYFYIFLTYFYLGCTRPAYDDSATYTPVVMAFAFLIGLRVRQIFMTPTGSGIDTNFVACTWDAQLLTTDNPDL